MAWYIILCFKDLTKRRTIYLIKAAWFFWAFCLPLWLWECLREEAPRPQWWWRVKRVWLTLPAWRCLGCCWVWCWCQWTGGRTWGPERWGRDEGLRGPKSHGVAANAFPAMKIKFFLKKHVSFKVSLNQSAPAFGPSEHPLTILTVPIRLLEKDTCCLWTSWATLMSVNSAVMFHFGPLSTRKTLWARSIWLVVMRNTGDSGMKRRKARNGMFRDARTMESTFQFTAAPRIWQKRMPRVPATAGTAANLKKKCNVKD